jgi:sporulation protein YlmC with PRC-barrel domain
MSAFRVAAMLGWEVRTEDGEVLGRVHDLRVQRRQGSSAERADQQWRLTGLVVGPRGLLERIGLTARKQRQPKLAHDLIEWEHVLKLDQGAKTILVREGARAR